MRTATAQRRARTPYWLVPVTRAVVALAIGLAITFTADHSSAIGLLYFGSFALATGIVTGLFSALSLTESSTRTLFLVSAVVSVLSGITALVGSSAGLGLYFTVVSVWALLTGALELFSGLRRRENTARRDWIVTGVLTLVLAVVMVIVPSDPVLAVGLLGAYAVVLGVYLAIGGLSLKWAASPTREVTHG